MPNEAYDWTGINGGFCAASLGSIIRQTQRPKIQDGASSSEVCRGHVRLVVVVGWNGARLVMH